MNVGEDDDEQSYWFWGEEIGYKLQTPLGGGNYRLLIDGTRPGF